jgi:hypothetical protein
MPRLKCVSACESIVPDCGFSINEPSSTDDAADSFRVMIGTFRRQFSHIRQPAQEEGGSRLKLALFGPDRPG